MLRFSVPFFRCAVAAIVLGASSVSLYAQQSLGTISGTVTDQTGAIVPNGAVTITNDQTSGSRAGTSNGSGQYSFQALPIGTYHVTIKVNGFNTEEISNVLVQADRTSTLNVQLKPGSVSTSVDVAATPS